MWSDLAQWFGSPAGQRALTDAVLPVVAIVVAAVLAALIARATGRRLERRLDREALVAAVGGFTEAARRAASGDASAAGLLAAESDVRLRFSGRPGAELAAEWALRVALAARSDDVAVVRDRLLAWAARPGRARRLFATDLQALEQPATTTTAGRADAQAEQAGHPGSEEQPPAVAATDHTNQAPRPPQPEVPAIRPADTGRSGSAQPAWLDDYDDDAHVTRNIPLNTPAPVAASAIRDRGRPGDDILPS
jgi:hypothetical protein